MKTLKDLFEKKGSTNSINNFASHLVYAEMLAIKGGVDDDPDEDNWPPSTTGSGN
jgi:hypothetical protein